MIALWHIDPNTSELRIEDSKAAQNQLFKSKCSMISTGTERLVSTGMVDDAFQDRMKVAYQSGSFNLPIKYGYSLVVEDSNGRLGHIMHPHQDYISAKEEDIFWIDHKIPAQRFALISNMETIINAIWDSEPTQNDKIGICGFGNIGSLLANTLRTRYNIEAKIIEQNPWRCKKAESLGWKLDNNESYDIIYHTAASESGLQFCIDHLNFEGKLLELSWYGNKKVNIELGKKFHYDRLKIISSQVSQIPSHMQGEHDYKSRKELALEFLQDDSFDELITDSIAFEDTPSFFSDLRNGAVGDGLIYVIEY